MSLKETNNKIQNGECVSSKDLNELWDYLNSPKQIIRYWRNGIFRFKYMVMLNESKGGNK